MHNAEKTVLQNIMNLIFSSHYKSKSVSEKKITVERQLICSSVAVVNLISVENNNYLSLSLRFYHNKSINEQVTIKHFMKDFIKYLIWGLIAFAILFYFIFIVQWIKAFIMKWIHYLFYVYVCNLK